MSKSCKSCKGKKGKRKSRSRVSGADFNQAFEFDVMEIAEIAAGAVGVKLVVNPIVKAIWKNKTVPKWASLGVKSVIALGLNSMGNRTAKNAAKGVVITILSEAAEMLAPTVFKPELKGNTVSDGSLGYIGEAQMIDLSADVHGTGDYEDYAETAVAGW